MYGSCSSSSTVLKFRCRLIQQFAVQMQTFALCALLQVFDMAVTGDCCRTQQAKHSMYSSIDQLQLTMSV